GQRAVGAFARRPRQPPPGRLRPATQAARSARRRRAATGGRVGRREAARLEPGATAAARPTGALHTLRAPRGRGSRIRACGRVRPRRRHHRRHPSADRARERGRLGCHRAARARGRLAGCAHRPRRGGRHPAARDPARALPRRAARAGGRVVIARVWAPRAATVELDRAGIREPMHAVGGGWWEGGELAPGERYGFALDGGATRPDPRGRELPDGVHGLSAARPPTGPLATPGWAGRELADAVLYELHIGTFTPGGTLDAAIERLDHLVRLGVDAVELLPVNAFNGVQGWGYDGVAWYAVHALYGGPDAYLRFVEAAHARGLAVIQDVVYNHLGPSGNYLPEFGPYLREDRNSWGETLGLDEPALRRGVACGRARLMTGRRVQPSGTDRQLPVRLRSLPARGPQQLGRDARSRGARGAALHPRQRGPLVRGVRRRRSATRRRSCAR